MAIEQDLMAPVKREEIKNRNNSTADKLALIKKIISCLNEKRDAYNGIISSMIFIIESKDEDLLSMLCDSLSRNINSKPMRYGGKIFLTRCLPRLIQEQPQFVADFFMKSVLSEDTMTNGISEMLSLKITALRAIGQAEQKAHSKLTTLSNNDINLICDRSIQNGDSQTKVDTLYILLDTKQATKILTVREFEVFLKVLQEAVNYQIPALRQKFLALANKTLKRMRDSIRVVLRDKIKYSDLDREVITKRYISFLEQLIRFCLDNIYCNKYFGSFFITMNIINYIIEHITLNNPNLPIAEFLQTRRFFDSILSVLVSDSFEDNKKLALNLILSNPSDIISENLELFQQVAYKLVDSVNPAHSLNCCYMFKLIVDLEHKAYKSSTKNALVYKHLNNLVTLVEEGIYATKNDFILAMKNNAIYPKLTCIRTLLGEVNVDDIESDRLSWETLTSRIIQSSIEACGAVSTFVCNMNPETIGHIPMDLKPIDIESLSRNLDRSTRISDDHISTITSQHLLIMGWKTIKECSLTMGYMCTELWWPQDDECTKRAAPILKSDDITSIVGFFEHYLRNLRHRGAFEQAYSGFVMVTKRIWLCEQFKNLLVKNLRQILHDFRIPQKELDIEKVEYLKKHVTRRSAGLPFLVQAIAVSESKHDSRVFRFIMDTLIVVMEGGKAEAFQKIHCLNILKALINDFNLGEKVTPYLGQIFMITLDSFKSDDFSIRNCANMLMRTLIDRTFGVNRLRNEIHRRNILSYEKFFSLHSGLQVKLEQILRDAPEDKGSFAAVHAVFIILSHLKPNVQESEDFRRKMIHPFINPVHQLALTCPDFKLRELAAKMFVQLEVQLRDGTHFEKYDLFELYTKGITNNWVEWTLSQRNLLHGVFCILKNWVANHQALKNCVLRGHLINSIRIVLSLSFEKGVYISPQMNSLRLAAIDLAESYHLSCPEDYDSFDKDWYLVPQETLFEDSQPKAALGPNFENMIFRSLTFSLTSARSNVHLLETTSTIIKLITQQPNQVYSVNLQAAMIRFLRQFFSESNEFVDNLMTNLDLDLTAAHITPIDKLNQRYELDSERELWLKYCIQPTLREFIRNRMPDKLLSRLFNFSLYNEFQPSSKHNVTKSNTPRSIELLAFACKTWSHYNIESRCIWVCKNETLTDKLEFVTKFISDLPNCDIKCLALKCASNLFIALSKQLCHVQKDSNGISPDYVSNIKLVANKFTHILEELTSGHHDHNIRLTCSEILSDILLVSIECWMKPLKAPHLNVFSALIKLCQDEEYEIRESASKAISGLNKRNFQVLDSTAAYGSRLDNFIAFISSNLLNPFDEQDVIDCFNLLVRVIFNHTKSSEIELSEERESLFDKTKPNVFADHVTTIQNTLCAAKKFFGQRQKPIDIDSIHFSSEVSAELLSSETVSLSRNDIGDYSWRNKKNNYESRKSAIGTPNNRQIVDSALKSIRQSLSYFSRNNMLIDTAFGYHESIIHKRLAFIRLLLDCTNYDNKLILDEIKYDLRSIVRTSCATTIMLKCQELFVEDLL